MLILIKTNSVINFGMLTRCKLDMLDLELETLPDRVH